MKPYRQCVVVTETRGSANDTLMTHAAWRCRQSLAEELTGHLEVREEPAKILPAYMLRDATVLTAEIYVATRAEYEALQVLLDFCRENAGSLSHEELLALERLTPCSSSQ